MKTSKSHLVLHYLNFLTYSPTTIIIIAHIVAYIIVGIVTVVEIPLVSWHRWEQLWQASVVAINRVLFVDI
jgi:hypothetical protein